MKEFSFRDMFMAIFVSAALTLFVVGGACSSPRAPTRVWGAEEMAISACEARCRPKEARIGDFERPKDRNDRWTLPTCYCVDVTEVKP